MATESRVLVVDDEHALRRLLRLYLENEGYTVLEADNGLAFTAELIRAIKARGFSLGLARPVACPRPNSCIAIDTGGAALIATMA
jgi:CheY-like chemotaxis protein